MTFKKQTAIIIMFTALIICLSSVAYASGGETVSEDDSDIQSQELPVSSQTQTKHMDAFAMAIILLSFGSMMLASATHRDFIQRKELQVEIIKISSFLENSCAVQTNIKDLSDNDPYMSAVKDIQAARNRDLDKISSEKAMTVNNLTDIEIETISLWS